MSPKPWRGSALHAALALGAMLLAPVAGAAPHSLALPSCGIQAAADYGVDANLVQAVRIAEGGRVGQSVCVNRNGTCDHGPMQINDGWFDGRFGVDLSRQYGIDKRSVISNECQNIRVGVWVLRLNYDRVRNWYEAIAAYNAGLGNRRAGYRYADRVFAHYRKLSGQKLVAASNTEPAPLRRLMQISAAE